VPQCIRSLVEFEMAQILQYDRRHRHAKRRKVILRGHLFLLCRVRQETDQATGQVLRAPGFVKLNRDLFPISHLAKIRKICAQNGYAVRAGQMRDSTAPRRRRVRHDGNSCTLEKVWQSLLWHVTSKLDSRIPRAPFPDRFHITRSLWMVATSDDQLGVGQGLGNNVKRFDHEFEPFVCSPFAEGQNAVLGIAAPGKIRILRSCG
jgi:hypothetical protein